MFGIGSFNPISLLATSMLGPIGGAVAQLAQQVFSQMGQQILQQFGDKLGLPQGIIDMAQSQFAGSIGDFQGAASNVDEALDQFGAGVGASPSDIAQAQNGVQQMMMQFIEEMSQSEEFKDAKASGGKGKVAAAEAQLAMVKENSASNCMQQIQKHQKRQQNQQIGARGGALTQQLREQ